MNNTQNTNHTTTSNTTQPYDWHICVVTGQPPVNLTPAIDTTLRPKNVLLLASKEMIQKGNDISLKDALNANGIKVEIKELIDSLDYIELSNYIENFIYKIKIDNNETVLLNITGGTKLMTLGMFVAAQNTDTAAIYLDYTSKKILNIFDPATSSKKLDKHINLLSYLKIHNHHIKKDVIQFRGNKLFTNYCQWAINTPYDAIIKDIGTMNEWTNNLSKSNQSKGMFDETKINNSILTYCLANDLAYRQSNGEIVFTHIKNLDFIKSEWIEYFTGEVINGLYHQKIINDYAINLEVFDKKDIANEFDCVFMANNTLHIIECKTQNMKADSGKAGQDAIYKIDSISNNIAGLTTKKMLVSFRNLNTKERERAAQKDIKVVQGTQIKQLSTHIKSWIKE